MGASGHIRLPSASFWLDLSSYMPSKFCRAKLKIKREGENKKKREGGGGGRKKLEKKGNYPLILLKKMLTNVLPLIKM